MAIGGARPGAGRKKKTTLEAQQSRRDVVISVLTAARLKVIVEHDVAAAEAGKTDRIDRWLPYVLGSPKQEIEIGNRAGESFSVTVEPKPWKDALAPFMPGEDDGGAGAS